MKVNSFKKQKREYLIYICSDKASKGTVVNRALSSFPCSVTWNYAYTQIKNWKLGWIKGILETCFRLHELNFIRYLVKRIEYIMLEVWMLSDSVQMEGHRVHMEMNKGQQLLGDPLRACRHITGVKSTRQTNRIIKNTFPRILNFKKIVFFI